MATALVEENLAQTVTGDANGVQDLEAAQGVERKVDI